MGEAQQWPDSIWIVRHGESAGNVARREAEAAGHPIIPIAVRDIDVPLSPLGEFQAAALGRWIADLPAAERPTAVLASPYLRARETARLALDTAGIGTDDVPIDLDERLREKEFGILDRLTNFGIRQHHPEQAEFRRLLGRFYHRPPGGESWCDVLLRLRSVIDTLCRDYCRERVVIVTHQVVVLCFRYLLECLTEDQILAADRAEEVANCSITAYAFDPRAGRQGKLVLRKTNFVAPLEAAGAPITSAADVPAGAK